MNPALPAEERFFQAILLLDAMIARPESGERVTYEDLVEEQPEFEPKLRASTVATAEVDRGLQAARDAAARKNKFVQMARRRTGSHAKRAQTHPGGDCSPSMGGSRTRGRSAAAA